MKKRIFTIALLAICASLAAYGTLAYFTYDETAVNVIIAGSIEIDLREFSRQPDGSLATFENIDDAMPATDYSKIVDVKNVGMGTAWIKVTVEKKLTLAEGVEGEIDLSLLGLDINTQYWQERDGCYYYIKPLQPDEKTEPLFTTVSFSSDMSNIYQHSSAEITVTAYAVQTANNGKTVFDAAGWTKQDQGGNLE